MIHIENLTNDWPEALDPSVLGPDFRPLVKAFSGDRLVTAKGANTNCRTILRYHYTKRQHFGGDWEVNKERARTFFRCFIDGTFRKEYARYTDYVEEWNEYLAPSLSSVELADRIRWAEAVAAVWDKEYRTQPEYAHIELIMCNAAIGNDIPLEFAQIARAYDCVMGYHPYTKWVDGVRDPGDFRWLSGRWEQMEKDWGIKLDWAFTECGPYQGPDDGWISDKCLGGNHTAYIEAMRLWIRDVAQTDAYREGRTLGFNPFDTGPTPKWVSFRTDQPVLNWLRDMYAVEWKPGQPIPLPPHIELPQLEVINRRGLNIRKHTTTAADIVGFLPFGARMYPTEIITVGNDIWARWGEIGCSAILYNGRTYLVPVEPPSDNDTNER